jgi:hypothetical protein
MGEVGKSTGGSWGLHRRRYGVCKPEEGGHVPTAELGRGRNAKPCQAKVAGPGSLHAMRQAAISRPRLILKRHRLILKRHHLILTYFLSLVHAPSAETDM